MSTERYVGERRALWHFLSELQPLIIASLGNDALLRHRIDRALKAGDLEQLRNARRMFHNLPDDLKRRLMRGIFDGTAAGSDVLQTEPGRISADQGLVDPIVVDPLSAAPLAADQASAGFAEGDKKPSAAIRFNAFPAARDEDIALSVERDDEGPSSSAPIQVTIETGTLPRSAAETLRQIANWIEHDRRLLSTQNWVRGDKRVALPDETMDQA